jgi:hypothetical protein
LGHPSPQNRLANATAFRTRPPCVRAASPHHRFARRWLRSTPSNGWTACRMRLHMTFGDRFRSHLRSHARAYAYRGLRAFASLSMARSERLTMNNQVYLLIGALLCCTFSCGLAQAQNPACHLHAPTDYTSFSNQPLVIPNVGSLSACEQFNLQRFSARGRCHRSQDQVSIKQRSGPVNYSGVINPPDFLP